VGDRGEDRPEVEGEEMSVETTIFWFKIAIHCIFYSICTMAAWFILVASCAFFRDRLDRWERDMDGERRAR
jgi:hypothetical protein